MIKNYPNCPLPNLSRISPVTWHHSTPLTRKNPQETRGYSVAAAAAATSIITDWTNVATGIFALDKA